jgi:general stress protein CsbA
MQTNMPKILKWSLGLIIAQLLVLFFIIVVALVTVSHKAHSGFWLGFQERLAAAAGASSLEAYGDDQAAYFSGAVSFSIFLLAISLFGIMTKRFWVALVSTILLVFTSLSYKSFPLFSIIVFFLICSPASQRAFKQRKRGGDADDPPVQI